MFNVRVLHEFKGLLCKGHSLKQISSTLGIFLTDSSQNFELYTGLQGPMSPK